MSEIEGSGVSATEKPSSRVARLTSAQMARMSRVLDEALVLDEAGRREWLAALNPEHQDIAEALREALSLGSAGTGEALSTLPKVGADADAGLNTTTSGLTAGARVGPYELIRPLGAGCHPQILSGATIGDKKYSWWRPPSTALARTATSSRRRCRDPELNL